VEAELFNADGRTDGRTNGRTSDMRKLIAAFRNFANAPKTRNWNNDESLVAPAEMFVRSDLKNVSARN